jgi:hypothetical protein
VSKDGKLLAITHGLNYLRKDGKLNTIPIWPMLFEVQLENIDPWIEVEELDEEFYFPREKADEDDVGVTENTFSSWNFCLSVLGVMRFAKRVCNGGEKCNEKDNLEIVQAGSVVEREDTSTKSDSKVATRRHARQLLRSPHEHSHNGVWLGFGASLTAIVIIGAVVVHRLRRK